MSDKEQLTPEEKVEMDQWLSKNSPYLMPEFLHAIISL